MKIRVTVDERTFEVEIVDLNARPIVAMVDGQRFEVMPEVMAALPAPTTAPRPPQAVPQAALVSKGGNNSSGKAVLAPMPGLITAVSVTAGATVQQGDPLVSLEAMKMNNLIRAPRAGTIAAVFVSQGQQVKHRDPLVEYAE